MYLGTRGRTRIPQVQYRTQFIRVFLSIISTTSTNTRDGHQSSRRQSSRRQTNSETTNSATRVGQLGDNLFRLSVCFVLIEQNKLSKKAVLSQGNAMLLLISNTGYHLKQVAGHANFLTEAPARENDLEWMFLWSRYMTLGSKNAKFELFGIAQCQIATMLHCYAASRKSRLEDVHDFMYFALSSVVSDILRRAGAWRHHVQGGPN